MTAQADLHLAARSIFDAALAASDASRAVRRAVNFERGQLTVADTGFDLRRRPTPIYSVAIGKAAGAMASALDEVLGDALAGGVISAPLLNVALSPRWQVFGGGHPLPNEASLEAARAAFALLRAADGQSALVIFLVSGGGSAMIEWPRDASVTLAELREANRALVTCGASIAEINAVRRAVSSVKGGGLSAHAPRATQVTLIISDTATNEHYNVASGPTFPPPPDTPDASGVVRRYDLDSRLPPSVLRAVNQPPSQGATVSHAAPRYQHVLLDNEHAMEVAAEAARALGFRVEIARDVCEQDVAEGSALLVSRLFELRRRTGVDARPVCLVSGGEFSCPVRGRGVGGRNSETALRCAFELEARADAVSTIDARRTLAFSAGTDGIDGNSPAAGAWSDERTLARARSLAFDPHEFLETSDAYTFFDALGNTIMTGATGTNVRDLRLMLAR
ncbi:MAG TPA: DUF4147 domain-containing protein [Pyrinomonadaceae bacterium]|nr:DUF4147 domain-containing protein [Pyrinomonadaceae bacterium]